MPTAEKAAVIEQTRKWSQEATGMVFTDYRGLKVPEIQALRQSLRDAGGEYHVVKNTLFRVAFGEGVSSLPDEFHNGPTATAFIFGEEPACAKVLVKFAKDHKGFAIKGAYFDGKLLSAADFEDFSKLPSKQDLLSMIVGLVQAPIANVVGTINEILAAPIRAIGAIAEKAPAGSVAKAEPAAPEAAEPIAPAPETADVVDVSEQSETSEAPAEETQETETTPAE
ncbi:MAG TPA: 50S ribosomal protein L10, partial [Fimbriimonadales bacterium]|nr:50S ribosomal protein L10 [Fimbriimonadales bacterium]